MTREQLTQPSTRSVLLVVLTLCLAVGLVFVPGAVAQTDSPTDDDPEPVPAAYYGNVTIVGDAAVDGIEVTAEVEGTEYGPLVTDGDGEYGDPSIEDEKLTVDPEEVPDDPEVTFFIESDEIDRTEVTQTDPRPVEWEEGDTKQVDLTVVLDDQDLPNLAATLIADDEQQLEDDLEAEVLVENIGETSTDEPAQVDITAEGSPFESDDTVELSLDDEVGELDPEENETVDISEELTDWSQDNETVDDVDLTAEVDPENEIQESSTSTNFDQTTVDVTYVNLEADATTRDSVVEGQNITLRSFITNDGTAAVTDRDVNVTVENGDSAKYNFTIDELGSGEQFADRTRESFDEADDYTMTVEIDDEDDDIFTADYTASSEFTVEEYNLTLDDAEDMRVPTEVRNESSFATTFFYETNASAPVNATIDLPDSEELELRSNENESKIVDSSAGNNTVSWRLNATDTTDENVSIDVDVEDTLGVEETDNVTVNTSVPQVTERTRDTNTTVLGPEDDIDDREGEFELQVRDSETERQNVTLSLEGGAEGRTLSGLEYLVRYPYGCVEQTTSSFLGALNTKQYYETRPEADISDDRFDAINGSIEEGIDRLEEDGNRGQLDDGGWNFWGRQGADSDTFATSYALLGISSVAEDDDYDEVENANINFTGAVGAIEDDQLDENDFGVDSDEDGAFDARSYFRDKNSMTGFTMVTLNQTVEGHDGTDHADTASIQANASAYLVRAQNESGAWEDHDTFWNDPEDSATSTGLAIWGLQAALENDDIDDEWDDVETDEEEVEDAIEEGHKWLIENQLTADDDVSEDVQGSWGEEGYHNSRWWSIAGDTSEEAAFATLGLDATNETVDAEDVGELNRTTNDATDNSTEFLTGVYETGGSWGYTRASTFAIGALTEVTEDFESDVTVDITLGDDAIEEELTISKDDPEKRLTLTLTDNSDELQDLRNDSEDGTVTVSVEQRDNDDPDTLNTVVVAVDNEQVVVEDGGEQ